MIRFAVPLGAVLGALGVVLGAFGAHFLETAVTEWSLSEAEQARTLDTWQTAVRYQMFHAIAIILAGLLARGRRSRLLSAATAGFIIGIAIFCGCLYAYVLTGVKALGAIVPIGGATWIVAWLLMAGAAAGGDVGE